MDGSMYRMFATRGLAPLPLLAALACSDDAVIDGDESSSSSDSSGTPTTMAPEGSTGTQGMSETSAEESSSSVGPVDTSSSSGTSVDLCGNGALDDGEGCDDGNVDDGDACRADCTLAFEVSWTALHNGPASIADAISAVWIDPAGTTYVLGRQRGDNGDDLWLQQYLPDGSTGAAFVFDGAFHGDDVGTALAPTSDGDLLVVGSTEVGSDDSDALALRITADLDEVVWQASFVGPFIGESSDRASTVLPTDDGAYISGVVEPDGAIADAWIARLDDGGNLIWETTFDDEMNRENDAVDVMPTDDGVLVFGSISDTYTRAGFAQHYDHDGVALGEPVTFDLHIREVVEDGEGGYLLAGYGDSRTTLLDGVLRKLDGDLDEVWSVAHDAEMSFDFGEGIAVDTNGNAYLVGQVARTGQQNNGFLMAYDSTGAPLWGDEYDNEDVNLDDSWRAVATDSNGDVVVVGYTTILGHQSDGFTRKYHPL